MIYKFRFLSDENEGFLLDIEIKDNQTFLEMHKAIQNSLNFDETQLASFFISDEEWNKGTEITLVEMTDDAVVMDVAMISEFIKTKKDRLIYVFDYLNERALFGALTSISKTDTNKKLPVISKLTGTPPKQSQAENPLLNKISEN